MKYQSKTKVQGYLQRCGTLIKNQFFKMVFQKIGLFLPQGDKKLFCWLCRQSYTSETTAHRDLEMDNRKDSK